ncbi:MAG: CDP-alcohol phosphatidyltransferase [Methanocella sp. PtaU1.Bin125]|nr:MAG: CDP-alcohol phosphatidyltransferase [Methanocella sp. PtaU1.Bin125]
MPMRLPGLANLITGARLVFIFLAALCIIAYTPDRDYYRWAAVALVVGAIVSDILDGKVARWLKQESYIGRLMDAAADAVGFTLGFVFLYFFDLGMRFPLWFVIVVVGRELAVYGLFLALVIRKRRIEKRPSAIAKWNTLLLALCILALLLRFDYSWALWVVAAATTLISGAENVRAAIDAIRVNNASEACI